MKRFMLCILIAFSLVPATAPAQDFVSAFKGSEFLGKFSSDFIRLHVPRDAGEDFEIVALEGKLVSKLYTKPIEKSQLEVFRSYKQQLEAADFVIEVALVNGERRVKSLMRDVSGRNDLRARPYRLDGKKSGTNLTDYVQTFADSYLLASKAMADKTVYVAVLIADRKDVYVVDTLTTEAMESNTVSLSPALLEQKITDAGKIAIYDIHFDTNDATIRPESAPALDTIASYLKAHPEQRFYVVGHTDDTGDLGHNMGLSARRADAVVEALGSEHGIGTARLHGRGAGPLAPVASNQGDDGRRLNRRVELVLRLKG